MPGAEGEGDVIAQPVDAGDAAALQKLVVFVHVGHACIDAVLAFFILKKAETGAEASQPAEFEQEEFVELRLGVGFHYHGVGQLVVVAQVGKGSLVEVLAARPEQDTVEQEQEQAPVLFVLHLTRAAQLEDLVFHFAEVGVDVEVAVPADAVVGAGDAPLFDVDDLGVEQPIVQQGDECGDGDNDGKIIHLSLRHLSLRHLSLRHLSLGHCLW